MSLLTRDPAPPARRPPALGSLAIRIQGGGLDGRVVRLQSPKCAVGSGPRCTLRVLGKGIRPLHCLIVRCDRGMFVRRWSPDTRLNGRPFEQAPLQEGDRLTIGPLHLEVLSGGLGVGASEPLVAETGSPPEMPAGIEADASADSPPADEALRQRIATHRKRARGLVEALRASRRHEQELSSQATEAQAAGQQVQQQVEQLTSEVRSAQDRAASLEGQLEALGREKAELAGEFEGAQRELRKLREAQLHEPSPEESAEPSEDGQDGEGGAAATKLQQRIDELSVDLEAHKERERALIAQLKLSKERQNALRQQLQDATSEQTRAAAQMQARLAELEHEKEELADLRREFQEERDRLAAQRVARDQEPSPAGSAEDAADAQAEPRSCVDEAEAAIAHLRELSLWSDDGPSEEPPEAPPQPSASGSPVSFLEKYAPQLLGNAPAPVAPRYETGSELPPKSDEDESLNDYMAKLMQRVRGDEGPPQPRKPAPRAVEPARSASRSSKPSKPAAPDAATAALLPADAAAETELPADQPAPFRLQDIKRSRALPERRSNFAAMRELANQTAHTAISDYRTRRIVQEAVMTLLSGSICLAAGLLALYLTTDLRSTPAIGGAAALLLAAYFFSRGVWGLWSIIREEQRARIKKTPKRRRHVPQAPAQPTEDRAVDASEDEAEAAVETTALDEAPAEEAPTDEVAKSSEA